MTIIFTYKARDKNGQVETGDLNALNHAEALGQLKSKGLVPLFIQEKKKKLEINIPFLDRLLNGFKLKDKLVFVKNLSGMLRSGLPLYRAISVLEGQAKKTEIKNVFQALMQTIHGGGTLSSGLEKFPKVFSPLFVSMVRAGEESGSLPESLDTVRIYLEKSYNLQKKVKGAMMYPMVILGAMLIIAILMMIFVIPTLVKMFEEMGTELPPATQVIIKLSGLFEKYPLIIVGAIIGFIFLVIYLLKIPKFKPFFHMIILKLPTVGSIVKELNTARTMRTLSSLLSAGVPLVRALEITQSVVQNIHFQVILQKATTEVVKGVQFSSVLRQYKKRYPEMAIEMIEVGEETGQLSNMLMDIAVFYEEEVENKTKDLSTIIEPVLMVLIGGAVGIFAVSMIQPMYSVLDSV